MKMRPSARFWMTAMIGYGIVVVIMAAGMILTAQRFDAGASGHISRIRAEEHYITAAERLRWSGEAIVSSGRGYLISGDPAFLQNLESAEASFDRGIQELAQEETDVRTTELVAEIARTASAFRARQEALVASMSGGQAHLLASQFESQLVPLQRKLVASLARMIEYKESEIDTFYAHIAEERRRLRWRMHGLLGVLVVESLAVSAYIATVLGRSYGKEQQAVEETRRAVAARDEIMGVVAHDLRNPLASIAMRGALLGEVTDIESARKHGKAIEAVSMRMEAMIKSMLDVTTIESGHLTVSPEPCLVGELLDETIDMFGGLAAPKQVRLERAPVEPKLRVRADRGRILQVLQNLVGNALKFTPQGGRVVVAADRDGEMIRFRVSDSGPGIPREHASCIFDRFWKHETGGKKGTGLGLFIAKGIIDAHGGRIWVESGSTPGATFSFTLPSVSLAGDNLAA